MSDFRGMTVAEGEDVQFNGSFTRPVGLENLKFTWEFGDGTLPVEGPLSEGVTTATATHSYDNQRPFSYTATLTVMADSEAGPVEASSQISVFVTESKGWVVAGWEAGATGRDAARALSGVGQGIATFLIWLGIFSPIWIGLVIATIVVRQRRRNSSLLP